MEAKCFMEMSDGRTFALVESPARVARRLAEKGDGRPVRFELVQGGAVWAPPGAVSHLIEPQVKKK
jgi:hypothetical protein